MVIALAGLVVLAPVIVVAWAGVRISSPGPAVFRQRRIGAGRHEFTMYKFRTMRTDAPAETPTHELRDAEDMITPFGALLRKTSLDELPQLWNVLRGDMSIVGPRPALWNQFDLIAERDRYGANALRPGITGWAQINGRDNVSIAEKAALDGYYVAHQGLLMDLRCIAGTIGAVICARNISEGMGAQSETDPDRPSVDARH